MHDKKLREYKGRQEKIDRQPKKVQELIRIVEGNMVDFNIDERFSLITIPFPSATSSDMRSNISWNSLDSEWEGYSKTSTVHHSLKTPEMIFVAEKK